VSYQVEANTNGERIAYITVEGQTHRVTQGSCVYYVTIGDNDGYGYGASAVPDNAILPASGNPNGGWIFDNRDSSERSANDGSQHTDYEPFSDRDFTFTIRFCQVDPNDFFRADFTLDVSGIEQTTFGPSNLYLDGKDFSQFLPTNQGAYGSQVVTIPITDVSLFTDGELTVRFVGAPLPNGDAIAFDYFRLRIIRNSDL
jgi:hypothetical protein